MQPLKLTIPNLVRNMDLGRSLLITTTKTHTAGSKENPKKFRDFYDGDATAAEMVITLQI